VELCIRVLDAPIFRSCKGPHIRNTTLSAQDCEDWDTVAAATGWTLEHCLAHKLAFKKKDDPKVKAEAMAAHMRRLRAAGRHLLHLTRS
jgi:hypothetical protein